MLLTGATGFIGRNILPILRREYQVEAPRRAELDLSSEDSVRAYLAGTKTEVLVHCAITNPAKETDVGKSVFNDTVDAFRRLVRHPFDRVVYIGSGAEYDKARDISAAREDEIGKVVPADEYGLAKFKLNSFARESANVFNVRIFGCYGPEEPERRFIRHAIECCLRGEPITIRRDCRFSYVHVADLGRAIVRLIEGAPRRHDYNIIGGSYLLSELAAEVKRQMGADVPIQILAEGFANEYTGDGSAFAGEFPDFTFMSIRDGIADEIAWMKEDAR